MFVGCRSRSATVGEISDALRAVWGDHIPKSSVVHNAYGSQYNESTDAGFDAVCASKFCCTDVRDSRIVD